MLIDVSRSGGLLPFAFCLGTYEASSLSHFILGDSPLRAFPGRSGRRDGRGVALDAPQGETAPQTARAPAASPAPPGTVDGTDLAGDGPGAGGQQPPQDN